MESLQFFKEMTTKICGTLDLSRALSTSFDYLSHFIPLSQMRITLLDTSEMAVKTIAKADRNGGQSLIEDPFVFHLTQETFLRLCSEDLPDLRYVPDLVSDIALAEVLDEHFSDIRDSSMLTMRLFLDGQRQGALNLIAWGCNRYRDEHLRIVESLNVPFAIAIKNALAHHEVDCLKNHYRENNHFLKSELNRKWRDQVIGAESGLSRIMELVKKVAPTDSPVLILGETGTGKEVIANALHNASARRNEPFVKLNCSSLPGDLIDSELFGHERGAFTGAENLKKGRFERADGGTLFLDEIGELSLQAQSKLLRVLQTGEYERVGGTETLSCHVRVIAATHQNLSMMIKKGTFREDLWYRINVFPVIIPPLRQRKEDIPALVTHFIRRKSREMGIVPAPFVEPESMNVLFDYSWPGNVRELENIIERSIILSAGGMPLSFRNLIGPEQLNETTGLALPGDDNKAFNRGFRPLEDHTTAYLREVLDFTGGKINGKGGAAEILRENPSTLRNRLRRLGIPFGREQDCPPSYSASSFQS